MLCRHGVRASLLLQNEDKSASPALRIFYSQVSAVGRGDLLGDAQAQAEVGTVRAGALGPVETLEDMGFVCVGDAGAIVDDPNTDSWGAAGIFPAAFCVSPLEAVR